MQDNKQTGPQAWTPKQEGRDSMFHTGKIRLLSGFALAIGVGSAQHAATVHAQGVEAANASTPQAAGRLETITVTARRKAESLQDVPDSIRAYSAEVLEAAGVRDVSGFVALTPNVTLRESFRQGQTYLTVRGITTGQQGWAPVTYVVDGVPVGSTDSINTGALVGIERIEVLKGPQGALYGAGAIAGSTWSAWSRSTSRIFGTHTITDTRHSLTRCTMSCGLKLRMKTTVPSTSGGILVAMDCPNR